jgi:uncharacterized membrane-anchored protein
MNIRLLLFFLVACVQVAVPVYLIEREEATLAHGQLYKFKTAPVDPVDALRGRYVALRFDAANVPEAVIRTLGSRAENDDETPYQVYATFTVDDTGYAQVESLSPRKPVAAGATLRVVIPRQWRGTGTVPRTIALPFDRFYMEEQAAPRAEAAYRQGLNARKDAYALVAIYHGHAAIKDLYVEGMPIREYLRVHP